MDFLPLSLIFFGSGMLALLYYHFVPSAEKLRERLPNKVSPAAILLMLIITLALWYLLANFSGFSRVFRVFAFLFALLIFESAFLILIRWIRSDVLAVILSLTIAGGLFAAELMKPSFLLLNSIVILATLGAATLLIRLKYLRTLAFFLLTAAWTLYDVVLVRYFLPRVFKPAEPTPEPRFFFFPVVTVGRLTLGSGDFMFLVLFALIILRDFGKLPAFILVVAESVALLATGLFLPEDGFQVPFLIVMTPIFFAVYFSARLAARRTASAPLQQ